MWTFFWLTLVAAILGLVFSFQKGEDDPWGIAKVLVAGVVMIVLVVIRCSGDEDPLDNDEPVILDPVNPGPSPSPINPFEDERKKWQDDIGTGILDDEDI